MLFVGDDWAEDHHDVEVQDEIGRPLAKARLEEGIAGIERLHTLLAQHAGPDDDPDQVMVGIETDRGPWVQALIASGYRVYAINPLQAPGIEKDVASPAPRAMLATPTHWPTWSAPMVTSCAPSPGTATRRRRSRW